MSKFLFVISILFCFLLSENAMAVIVQPNYGLQHYGFSEHNQRQKHQPQAQRQENSGVVDTPIASTWDENKTLPDRQTTYVLKKQKKAVLGGSLWQDNELKQYLGREY